MNDKINRGYIKLETNTLTWESKHAPTPSEVVLIVSDQDRSSELWVTLFRQKGFTIVQETPENALQTCKVVDPALIVISSYISHEKRIALCKNLRTLTAEPIFLLVTNCDSTQIIEFYNAGVNEYLLRPVSPAFLVLKAKSWLLKRRWLAHNPA